MEIIQSSCANPHQSFLFIFYYLISSFSIRCPKSLKRLKALFTQEISGRWELLFHLKSFSFSLHFLSLLLASSNDISYNISVWQAKAQIEKCFQKAYKKRRQFAFMIKYFCFRTQMEKKRKFEGGEKTHHRLKNDSDNIKIHIIHMSMKGERKINLKLKRFLHIISSLLSLDVKWKTW